MFCERCGANIGPGEMFCANCGTRVSAVPTRNIYPNNPAMGVSPAMRRPAANTGLGAKASGKIGFILAGLGVLMFIWTLLPVIKVDLMGLVSFKANLFQINQYAAYLEISLGWLVAVTIVAIVLAIAAGLLSGLMKMKVMKFVGGGVCLVTTIIWIVVTSKASNLLSNIIAEELGVPMHINIFGAGMYLLIITLIAYAALAIFTGIKDID